MSARVVRIQTDSLYPREIEVEVERPAVSTELRVLFVDPCQTVEISPEDKREAPDDPPRA